MSVGVLPTPEATIARDRSELILAQLDRLPTISTSLAKLLEVTGNSDSSARDLAAVIEPDPSLTAAVLRMVGRSDRGVRQVDMSVAKAVRLLGFEAVRNAALSHQFFQSLPSPDADDEAMVRRAELWRHCISTACAAQQLADALDRGPCPGEAFVAGLLHDVGKIALDACFPKSYARVVERCEGSPDDVCDAEIDVFGLDHTVAGRRLASRWGLPAPIVEAVWLHHQPPDQVPSAARNPALIRVVHLADQLVRSAASSRRGVDVEAACEALGLSFEAAVKVLSELDRLTAPLLDAVGLNDTETRAGRLETLTRVNLELSRTNARLMDVNEKLVRRDRCLDALSLFLRRGQGLSLAECCAAASDALHSVYGGEHALVLAADDSRTRLHVGVSGEEDFASRATLIEHPGSEPLTADSTPGVVEKADEFIRDLWDRFVDSSSDGQLSVLVLEQDCIAVFPAGSGVAAAPTRGTESDESLVVRALGSAISSRRARDASERMTDELLSLNRRLAAAQHEVARQRSLSMIAAMAGGAAHEINNPLAVISGRAQLEQSHAQDPETRKVWETIVEQAHKASGIVSELMEFAKPKKPAPLMFPLAELVQAACQRCGERRGVAPAQFRQDFADPAVTVFCDPRQLSQVLEALLDNALDATDNGVKAVEINSRSTVSDETVRLRVKDDGVGMVPEVLEHALDPFFSSRPAGRGRGLGLSRAYRLVEINGGRLWIESSPSLGTTVTVELPAR